MNPTDFSKAALTRRATSSGAASGRSSTSATIRATGSARAPVSVRLIFPWLADRSETIIANMVAVSGRAVAANMIGLLSDGDLARKGIGTLVGQSRLARSPRRLAATLVVQIQLARSRQAVYPTGWRIDRTRARCRPRRRPHDGDVCRNPKPSPWSQRLRQIKTLWSGRRLGQIFELK